MGLFVTNAFKGILILLTICSFVPQYHRIAQRNSSRGISPYYVLFICAVATEELNLFLDLVVCTEPLPGAGVPLTPKLGDWLDLAQMEVHWMYASILVMLVAAYSPNQTKVASIPALWAAMVVLILVPCALQLVFGPDEMWVSGVYRSIHLYGFNHIFTLLGVVAVFPQIRVMERIGSPKALSPLGLLLQAVLYTVLAVSWAFRIPRPASSEQPDSRLDLFAIWWVEIGWAAIDHAVYAVMSAILYFKCVQLGEGAFGILHTPEERMALLKDSVRGRILQL